ncbi:MAG: hypothetical protein H6Q90_4533 [Deltaproteobacteria bacterium]|nr:hypothetical protein [Deltaproteobacteria bacterium]
MHRSKTSLSGPPLPLSGTRLGRTFALLLVGLLACGDAKQEAAPITVQPAKVVPSTQPQDPGPGSDAGSSAGSGSAAVKAKDDHKGDQQDSEWVPAEFKKGMSRWKDIGVYIDGKPIGFLTYGELPTGLKPTWIKDKVSDRKRPGTDDPGWKWARQRFYKFTDYLKAVGVDIRQINELHIYGPKMSQTFIVSGKDLATPAADKLMFRFGANISGKPIPAAPNNLGNGKIGDKISAVMVYLKKKPPILIRNEGLELDGQPQLGVPYYGEPIRGGIRIYLDDKLAAIIKRQELDPKQATKGADGELYYKLSDVFTANGVDTKKVVEVYVIRDERRQDKLPAAELATLTFSAGAQAKGGVVLGDSKIRANALALHTRPIKPGEIDQPTPDDE